MQICCSQCGVDVEFGTLGRCNACAGILQPQYGDEAVQQLAQIQPGSGLDRYRAVLPVSTPLPYLGEGNTPLLLSKRIGPAAGLDQLFLKLESCNPSGAFKDRAGALVAALALDAGSGGLLTASSGNAAAAVSAYGAAAGLKCLILLEPGSPPTKLRQALATGARVLPVEGVFAHGPEAISRLMLQVAEALQYYPAFVWAPVNPYILEGIKTITYEVVAQLSGPPDVVVCPVGGGDMFVAQWRGYLELKRAGVIDRLPRMVAVQSVSAPPLLKAFESGAERVPTLSYANSRISGINVPFTGEHTLVAVRQSGGTVVGVTDEDIFAAQRRVGYNEGVWLEPAAAAPVAALARLVAKGKIRATERVVCICSGAGFKDVHLAQPAAEAVSRQAPVPFDPQAVVRRARLAG